LEVVEVLALALETWTDFDAFESAETVAALRALLADGDIVVDECLLSEMGV
jgi:hypothetical protein